MKTLALRALVAFLLVALAVSPALAQKKKDSKTDIDQIGNRDTCGGLNWYSLEKQIALGKQYAQEIERSVKLVDDPIVNEYVNRVGQNIVRNSDAKVPFTIRVLDNDEVNAFALPGGFRSEERRVGKECRL